MQPRQDKSSPINVGAISQPRHSQPALSAFQVPVRGSNTQINEPQAAPSNRPYLIAVLALLFGVIGVLVFLLLL